MKYIKLSKEEKAVLQMFQAIGCAAPIPEKTFKEQGLIFDAETLAEKNFLAKNMLKEMRYFITEKGKAYLVRNPGLKNPFPWDIIMRYATLVAAIAATLALFIGCVRLIIR